VAEEQEQAVEEGWDALRKARASGTAEDMKEAQAQLDVAYGAKHVADRREQQSEGA
jgi:hypothetical protein